MFINDLKLLLRFNTSSIYEEVSQTYLNPQGDNKTVNVLSNAYMMIDNQYLLGEGISYGGYDLDISNSFTIGFWFYPINEGMVTNEATGNANSVIKPLLDFTNADSGNLPVIKITDSNNVDNENYLTVSLNDNVYSASSQNYDADKWHFFWITYNGNNLFIYVDGTLQILQNETGSLPSSLTANDIYLYINHSLDGYDYNIAKNNGYISNIFFLDSVNNNIVDIQRCINDGEKYLFDDDYINTYIEKYSIYFDDPNTITINTSIDDMSYIYIGRNDGKILRGSSLLWETRRLFSDISDLNELDLSSDSVVNGFLKLKNKNLRL